LWNPPQAKRQGLGHDRTECHIKGGSDGGGISGMADSAAELMPKLQAAVEISTRSQKRSIRVF